MLFIKKLLLYDRSLFCFLGIFIVIQIGINVLNKDIAPFFSFSMFAGPAETKRLNEVTTYVLVTKDGKPILNPFNDFHKMPFTYTVDYYEMLHKEKGRNNEIKHTIQKYKLIGIKSIDSGYIYSVNHYDLYNQWLLSVYKPTENNIYIIRNIYNYTTTSPILIKTDTLLYL